MITKDDIKYSHQLVGDFIELYARLQVDAMCCNNAVTMAKGGDVAMDAGHEILLKTIHQELYGEIEEAVKEIRSALFGMWARGYVSMLDPLAVETKEKIDKLQQDVSFKAFSQGKEK